MLWSRRPRNVDVEVAGKDRWYGVIERVVLSRSHRIPLLSLRSSRRDQSSHAMFFVHLLSAASTPKFSLLTPSRLALTAVVDRLLLLLPLLRCCLATSKSPGCKPVDFANRFSTSVRLTTPVSLPDMFCPGSADAETDGADGVCWNGGLACGKEVVR